MERRWKKTAQTDFDEDDEILDLDSLLHPAQAFEHPSQVVNDPDLTLKRKARDPRVMGIRRVRDRGSPWLATRAWQQKSGSI
jgi:hypothetical protein